MNIIELAKQAGIPGWDSDEQLTVDHLERFAALVRAEALAEPKCHCDSPGWCKQYSRCHRKMLGLPPAPKAEPVAWAMPLRDGVYIDIITPEEHAREPGQYTVPLYTAPQPRLDAAAIRAQALEEAADICDREFTAGDCAAAIRQLKEKT